VKLNHGLTLIIYFLQYLERLDLIIQCKKSCALLMNKQFFFCQRRAPSSSSFSTGAGDDRHSNFKCCLIMTAVALSVFKAPVCPYSSFMA